MKTCHEIIKGYRARGFTFRDIALHFGISVSTAHDMHENPDYKDFHETRIKLNQRARARWQGKPAKSGGKK